MLVFTLAIFLFCTALIWLLFAIEKRRMQRQQWEEGWIEGNRKKRKNYTCDQCNTGKNSKNNASETTHKAHSLSSQNKAKDSTTGKSITETHQAINETNNTILINNVQSKKETMMTTTSL